MGDQSSLSRLTRRDLAAPLAFDEPAGPKPSKRATPLRNPERRAVTEERIINTGKSANWTSQNAACVQRSINSRNSAIHIEYRSSLRSSSLLEPRHSPL